VILIIEEGIRKGMGEEGQQCEAAIDKDYLGCPKFRGVLSVPI
jgi:hypothetical protein